MSDILKIALPLQESEKNWNWHSAAKAAEIALVKYRCGGRMGAVPSSILMAYHSSYQVPTYFVK